MPTVYLEWATSSRSTEGFNRLRMHSVYLRTKIIYSKQSSGALSVNFQQHLSKRDEKSIVIERMSYPATPFFTKKIYRTTVEDRRFYAV